MNLNLNFQINTGSLTKLKEKLSFMSAEKWVVTISIVLAFSATAYYFATDAIVAYGDAESHLNIAKRVVHSLTPGFAQLGGIWLPLPHILLLPLVYFNSLWRSGLAGSIISGIAFVISSLYIYKLTFHISKNKVGSIFAALVFMLNLNILYLQATPMTELPLIVFFILSTYYFVRFLDDESRIINLLLAAFFGFCATLSRYDGWFLVGVEAVILFLKYLPMSWKNLSWRNVFTGKIFNFRSWGKAEGMLILFGTLAFFGIVLWLTWDFLILGDPLYFTHSQFSAKSQQQGWLGKGQLPAYQNLPLSLLYYAVTMMSTLGLVVFTVAFIGFFVYLFKQPQVGKFFVGGLLVSTFFFYVITLYLGQSIIFIPHLTPPNFEATLFNVRYGVMMVPFAAVFFGYFVSRIRTAALALVVALFAFQFILYGIGYSQVLSYEDGQRGLSQSKRPDAERFLAEHYDNGLILLDDYSRLVSIIRADVPMENVIYVGNKPYWEESLEAPEKHAKWIVVQKNDEIWNHIYAPEYMQGRLYKYFEKVYTSPEILIFKRNENVSVQN